MGNQFRFLFSYRTNKNLKIMKMFIATAALATAAASAAPHNTGIPHSHPHVTNGEYDPSYQQILPSALPFYGGLVPLQPVVQQQPKAAEVSVEKREAHEIGVPHPHPHQPETAQVSVEKREAHEIGVPHPHPHQPETAQVSLEKREAH